MVVSPHSVVTALTLLSQGTDGNSFEQIKRALHVSGDKLEIATKFLQYRGLLQRDAGKVSLTLANQIYVRENTPLNKNFQGVARKYFRADVDRVDFSKQTEAASKINHRVAELTHGKIKQLLDPRSLSPASRVVLVNAIRLKAEWEHQFERQHTQMNVFYTSENERARIDFMHTTKRYNHAVLKDLHAQVLEMKYADSDLSMMILLPDSRTGLKELETKVYNSHLGDQIVSKLQEKTVEVKIPKFKIQHKIELNDVLKQVCD